MPSEQTLERFQVLGRGASCVVGREGFGILSRLTPICCPERDGRPQDYEELISCATGNCDKLWYILNMCLPCIVYSLAQSVSERSYQHNTIQCHAYMLIFNCVGQLSVLFGKGMLYQGLANSRCQSLPGHTLCLQEVHFHKSMLLHPPPHRIFHNPLLLLTI